MNKEIARTLRASQRRSPLFLAVLLLGLAATVASCWLIRQEIAGQHSARFEQGVTRNIDAITGRVETYIAMLRGGVGLFNALGEPTAEQFAAFTESLKLETEYPGIRGIGYSKRLPASQVRELEAQQRAAGRPDFQVWPPAPGANYRHSIVYLQPLDERNQAAIGYDMFSEERRREAMSRARDTGQPAATAKLTLVQEIDDDVQPGFLIYVPIYDGGEAPATVEERRERLTGFIYSPFRAHDLFRGIMPEQLLQVASFAIYDGETPAPTRLIYEEVDLPHPKDRLSAARKIELAGRPFTIVFHASPILARSPTSALLWTALAAGATLSLVLAALTWRLDTARLRAELSEANLRLRDEELALRSRILENMNEGVLLIDERGTITYANEAEERMFGYDSGEMIGLNGYELSAIPQESKEERWLEIREALADAGKWSGEWMNRRKDGSVFYTDNRVNAVTLGGRSHHICVQRDTTESRAAAEAFAESEARFRAVVETTTECVKIVSTEGRLEYMNPAGRSWLGLESDDFTRYTVEDFVEEPYLSEWLSNHQRVCQGELLTWQYKVTGTNGIERWLETRAAPIRLVGGSTGQIGVTIDITEHKRLEAESAALLQAERAARAEAERVGRMKDEFLATLSHELRTPLTAIIGWADLMRNATLSDEDVATGLETIQRNAQAQFQLTDDLLDMNRIISGKILLEPEPVNLHELIDSALETAAPLANAKGVSLEKRVGPLPESFQSDPSRLRQVLWNLLTNAVKFTPPEGRVTLSARGEQGELHLEVEDTGKGISPEFLPHVFDRFRQADSSNTRSHGGLGLGLSIVKSIVEMHGGSATAESRGEGQGARFSIRLPPLASAKSPTHHPDDDSQTAVNPLAGKSILVVEDEKDSRDIIERMLKQSDAIIHSASSAREGWEIAEKTRLDLIVSDIGMPEIDGYSFLRGLRERSPQTAREVPAIALTAFARNVDRTRSQQAGYQMHLAKPVEATKLLRACAETLGA